MLKRSIWIFVAAAAAVSVAVQDSVLLRRELKPNTTTTYSIESKVLTKLEVPGMGSQEVDVTTTMKQAIRIKDVDEKGIANVEFVVTDMKSEFGGEMGQMMGGMVGDMPTTFTQTGRMDNRYRITDMRFSGANAMAQMMGGGSSPNALMFELPEAPVRIGDEWDVVVPPNPMMGNKPHKLRAKLTGLRTVDGVEVAEINVTGTIEYSVDMAEMMRAMGGNDPSGGMMAGMRMTMSARMGIDGTVTIERATGLITSSVTNLKVDQTTELTDMGMQIPATSTGTITMKLVR
ncbi:MAG: hypothetical protein SNJ74_06630 [Fimbriimonadaceae bacterium]